MHGRITEDVSAKNESSVPLSYGEIQALLDRLVDVKQRIIDLTLRGDSAVERVLGHSTMEVTPEDGADRPAGTLAVANRITNEVFGELSALERVISSIETL